jgi:hypothetical protein
MTLVPLRCRCGQARGSLDLGAPLSKHVVCYCNDCRAFMVALGREDLLDPSGGSELYVTAPSRLKLTAGSSELRCVRLSDKGMLRWHWACCNTPLANTRTAPGLPFVSIHRAFIELGDGHSLGPLKHVQTRHATASLPSGAKQWPALAMIVETLAFLGIGRLRGAQQPNPLFAEGLPRVTPHILSADERIALGSGAAG